MADSDANEPARNGDHLSKYTMSVAVMLSGVYAYRIRRFEQAGLLRPARTPCRQRLFSEPEIKLIKEMATLEDEGINLPGIKAILEIRHGERE